VFIDTRNMMEGIYVTEVAGTSLNRMSVKASNISLSSTVFTLSDKSTLYPRVGGGQVITVPVGIPVNYIHLFLPSITR